MPDPISKAKHLESERSFLKKDEQRIYRTRDMVAAAPAAYRTRSTQIVNRRRGKPS
jgi:hypothetical protein